MSNTDELLYARDVLWVYENLGTPVDNLRGRQGVTSSRLILFEWIGTPEGRETFLKTLLPKAQDALVKAKANRDPDSIVEKETKSIAQLREFVKTVVSEALSDALEDRDRIRRQSLGKTGMS